MFNPSIYSESGRVLILLVH